MEEVDANSNIPSKTDPNLTPLLNENLLFTADVRSANWMMFQETLPIICGYLILMFYQPLKLKENLHNYLA